jgi:hypothetical protein
MSLECWMRVGQPLEPLIDDYPRIFDAWEAGGVRGFVLGRMVFQRTDGTGSVAAFTPRREIYAAHGLEPPAPPEEEQPEKRRRLEALLTDAQRRGWPIWIFEAAFGMGPGGTGPLMLDEQRRRAYAARLQDTLAAFPMAEGAIMDGPEWGYEIDPGHRSYLFHDLPPAAEPAAQALGYDYARLTAARDRLFERLHSLTPDMVWSCAGGGLFGAFALLGDDPDLLAWFRFRQEAQLAFVRGLRETLAGAERPIGLAMDPRTPAVGALAGYDIAALGDLLDLVLPKHYYFHRGFDGLYGTVGRYISVLTAWNPGLSDREALEVVRALFGLALPGVTDRRDMDHGFPPEFFAEVVTTETRRALAAVGDADRVIPWVDTGRRPHAGDPMTSGDLHRILIASQEAGLRRFLYHNHAHLTPAEWSVITDLCGEPWQPTEGGYEPPDGVHRQP